jgi:two-component system KDP operon response regulator KdpE
LRTTSGEQIATLLVPSALPAPAIERLRRQLAPALGALVAIALRRDAMQAEAVRTEALRRSDDVKTALLRAVSHDLRTPLTAIVAAGHALGTGELSDQERIELSDAVVEEGTRLASLVDKLLDLSRLQAGKAEPRRDWVSLEDVLAAAREALTGPGEVRVTIDPEVPEILADAAQLERAFANLLENARRYSRGLPVSVHARRRAHARSGMSSQAARQDRPRVLVCDDEQQILRALRVILRDAGFEALPASTAEEALDVAAVRRPDAAIVDLVLPDGDGIDVCRRLREWSDMPLIVLSAVGDEDAKVRALAAGADDYVTKPFGPRELIARLEANLRRIAPEPDEAVVSVDGLEIDLARRAVAVGGSEVHLTPTEFELLRQLVRNRGRLMTHRQLLVSVWGAGYADDTQVLRAHIANLRRKIEPAGTPRHIRTDPGVGYRFAA